MTSKPTIRCSGLDRFLNCPGSRTLEDAINAMTLDFGGIGEGHAMTWRGNWCHYESARRLIKIHGAIGTLTDPVLPRGWSPSPWDEREVEWYLANLLAHTDDDHAFIVERRYTVDFGRFVLSGQLDCHTLNPSATEADIDDLKSGLGEVDIAEENWQLCAYAVLLWCHYPSLKRVRARIFQRGSITKITEVVIDDLKSLARFLEEKINAALDSMLHLNTGYKQCLYCPAPEICPAIYKELVRMKHILTTEELANLQVVPEISKLAAVAAEGRALKGPIEKILTSLKLRIQQEGSTTLPDGTTVSVIDAPGARDVPHTQAAFVVVADKIGEDAAWGTLSLSLGAVEDKLVDSGMKRTSKKSESAEGWIKEHMNHLIVPSTIKKLVFK